jgi:hypothetical protein
LVFNSRSNHICIICGTPARRIIAYAETFHKADRAGRIGIVHLSRARADIDTIAHEAVHITSGVFATRYPGAVFMPTNDRAENNEECFADAVCRFSHSIWTGNFHWLLDGVKNDTEQPRAIYPLNPGRVRVKIDESSFPWAVRRAPRSFPRSARSKSLGTQSVPAGIDLGTPNGQGSGRETNTPWAAGVSFSQ